MDPARLKTIVRRVSQRVLARPSSTAPRLTGVHVQELEPRPGEAAPPRELARDEQGLLLVTAEDLAGHERGSSYAVPAGARVTPLAREEAWQRGITLCEKEAGACCTGRTLRVALGADHGGYAVKQELAARLRELGHTALDLGTHDESPVDYPDLARAVAEAVAGGRADFGVCVDGAGIGSAIAANKVPGVRAAQCWDERTARNAREHNFANVLSLGGPLLGAETCRRVLEVFLSTPEGAPRHARRVDKIAAIEAQATGRRLAPRRVLPSADAQT